MSKRKIISLIGPPGVGKTTIGKELAERLDWRFIDTDEVMGFCRSAISNMTFRQKEHFAVNWAITCSCNVNFILSTGGSTFLWPECQRLLLKHTYVIFLDDNPRKVWERFKNRKDTIPVVGLKGDTYDDFCELFFERRPKYLKAHSTYKLYDTGGVRLDPPLGDLLMGIRTGLYEKSWWQRARDFMR